MIHGRYIGVITDFDDPLAVREGVRQGYLKVAWKDGSSLKTGYIIIKDEKIVGSLVENVIGGSKVAGNEAFGEIMRAIKDKLVKAVEVYEADVEEILGSYPETRVDINELQRVTGNDLGSLLMLLKTHHGGMRIQNGSKEWVIYVENGLVKAAKAIKGSTRRGDSALREILREMGHLIKDGVYIAGETFEFSPNDTVSRGDVFVEGLELLKEKRQLEKGF
ncbi:DUF2226 domain-containing protein [Thermococcus sp.]|uniref:DUF2226 domain-containing protein n=1 Tax=Thermococcus sp. TaxID=35749 RepID=UPI002601BF84|nr:DUF2226 domain-containing protein [Thermococcus sp.]